MIRETLSLICTLSQETRAPERSQQAMQELLFSNLKLVRTNSTLNLLNSLLRRQIGTNEVERYAKIVVGQCAKMKSERGLVMFAMRHKVRDAWACVQHARYVFIGWKKELYKWMKRGSYIDIMFQRAMPESRSHLINLC